MADKLPGMKQTLNTGRTAGSVGRAIGIVTLTLLLALVGCGQKGPLTLPSDKPAKAGAATPASAPQR